MNSGEKGKRFELKVAKHLSQWSGLELMRTPMSGGWAGETADIVPKFGAFFPFVVECKHEEGWELDNLLLCNGPFPSWMAQAIEQAEYKSNSTGSLLWPMLCFTRNRRPTYVMIPYSVWVFGRDGSAPNMILVNSHKPYRYVIGILTDILEAISYQKVLLEHERQSRQRAAEPA